MPRTSTAHARHDPCGHGLLIIRSLFKSALILAIDQVRQKLATSFPTGTAAVKVPEDLGIATELTGQKKNRSYSYAAYIGLLAE